MHPLASVGSTFFRVARPDQTSSYVIYVRWTNQLHDHLLIVITGRWSVTY